MKRFPFCLLAFFSLTGCAAISGTGSELASVQLASFSSIDSAYAAALGQEYSTMTSLFRANGDYDAASKFDVKANAAANGQWVFPDAPMETEGEQTRAYGDLNEGKRAVAGQGAGELRLLGQHPLRGWVPQEFRQSDAKPGHAPRACQNECGLF
jgi:hypothetical protein